MGTPTVVIVDDDADARTLLREQFRFAGFDVVAALADGTGALDVCARAEPAIDYVVVDKHLVGEDGEEVAARLRLLGRSMRVAVCSSLHRSPEVVDKMSVHLPAWVLRGAR